MQRYFYELSWKNFNVNGLRNKDAISKFAKYLKKIGVYGALFKIESFRIYQNFIFWKFW